MNKIKYIRVSIAVVFILVIGLFFLDFLEILPLQLHSILHIQWVPALLYGNVLIIVCLLLLSLLFGRIFCSAICPLGIFQDILIRIENLFLKKKKRKLRYKYRAPSNILRYSILLVTLATYLFGFSALLLWLDPYSNFGRIVSLIFRPAVMWANNLFAGTLNAAGVYSVFEVPINTVSLLGFIAAILFFILLVVMTVYGGRLYCNTICPVGTALGLLNRFSLFKVRIDKSMCTSCGLCAMSCKSECIDSKTKEIDDSRCISCYNCLDSCKKGGVQYQFVSPFAKSEKDTKIVPANLSSSSRRSMFRTVGIALWGTLSAKHLWGQGLRRQNRQRRRNHGDTDPILNKKTIMPPSAGNLDDFYKKCTGCQLCTTKCPSHVLKPASIKEYGFEGILQPYMSYTNGFCNYNCKQCADVCPTGALKNNLTIEEKRLIQCGVAEFRQHLCIVITEGTSCGACSEHCPTQAVKMVPYKDGLTLPQLDKTLCIGCGGCEYICPVLPHKAIYIEGLPVQGKAKEPERGKEETHTVDDFGF